MNVFQSCEHIRVALEGFEPQRDQEVFVRDYATGSAMPDPPGFVDYNSPDAVPSASARITSRPANFARQSQRQRTGGAPLVPPAPAPGSEDLAMNQAGIGSAGGGYANGASSPPAPPHQAPPAAAPSRQLQQTTTGAGSQYRAPPAPADPDAEPIGPNSATMLKIGNQAYPVDLGTDPQQAQGMVRAKSPMVPNGRVGDEMDPLRQQMAALRTGDGGAGPAPAASSGSARRNSVYNPQPQAQQQALAQRNQTGAGSGLGLPNGADAAAARNRDYRNSAEFIVGAYPASPNSGGSATSGVPRANFMLPPSQGGDGVAEEVVRDYGQSFPGERRLSRQNSRRSSFVGHSPNPSVSGHSQLQSPSPQPNQTPRQGRPVSREGHAGIGANGRSASPGIPISRAASPALHPQQTGPAHRPSHTPSASTNSIGIALDPSGKVAVDAMADPYLRQQQQQAPQRQPSQSQNWQQQQQQQQQQQAPPNQRRSSFNAPPPQGQMVPYGAPPPGPSPTYAAPPPAQQAPPPLQQYPQQVQRQPTSYQPSPYAQPAYAPPPPPPQQQQPAYQPPPQQYQPPPQQQQQQQQYRPTHQSQSSQYSQYGGGYQQRAPSPQPMAVAPRSPSPQPPSQAMAPPTGQYTEDGKPVLFYGSSLCRLFSAPHTHLSLSQGLV
jgi:hypothetical protein